LEFGTLGPKQSLSIVYAEFLAYQRSLQDFLKLGV
jgi:hypothetical protein